MIAAIESTRNGIVQTVKEGVTAQEMQNMLQKKRITIITPEFSAPLLDQEIKVEGRIKSMGLMGAGNCKYTCKFQKDVLYPNENLRLTVDIDNSKCSKKIDKYKVKVLR